MSRTVLVAMSGGVDSSVAAYLLQRGGYDCVGATLLLSGEADSDAGYTAARLGIPFYAYDYRQAFDERVIRPFIQSYLNGATPNPCVLCNPSVKFAGLLQLADELGIEYIATGHYAVTYRDEISGRHILCKAEDASKDQSYALYGLSQSQLARTMFPLGKLSKTQAREIAAAQGFINADRRDSQDICFIPGGDYAAFIEKYTDTTAQPGDFVDADGGVIGRHKGLIRYTVGQRKGLGLALEKPLYVAAKDADTNTVTLCEHEGLFKESLYAADFNWVSVGDINKPTRVTAKARYSHREQPATAIPEGGGVRVTFDKPQRAITKGQSVVLYDNDAVLGGGIIV